MNKLFLIGMQILSVGVNGIIAGMNLASQGNMTIAVLNLLLVVMWFFLAMMNIKAMKPEAAPEAAEE